MTARIPVDFWIGGAHLPAGDSTLDYIFDTLVVFRNPFAGVQKQVFLLPTGERVTRREDTLVYLVHSGEHNLQDLWS